MFGYCDKNSGKFIKVCPIFTADLLFGSKIKGDVANKCRVIFADEVLGLPDKDVDLRNLPSSPSKKRPSLEKLLDAPPAKKTKAEVMDE